MYLRLVYITLFQYIGFIMGVEQSYTIKFHYDSKTLCIFYLVFIILFQYIELVGCKTIVYKINFHYFIVKHALNFVSTANNSGNDHLTQTDQSNNVVTTSASLITTTTTPKPPLRPSGFHDSSTLFTSTASSSAGDNNRYTNTTANDQPDYSDQSTLDLESLYQMLEPNLRPATPDASNHISQQIYEQHNDIAREYLKVGGVDKLYYSILCRLVCIYCKYILIEKVQTEIAYVTKHREELLAAMDADQRRERLDIAKKIKEKVSESVNYFVV